MKIKRSRARDFVFYMALLILPLTQFCIFYIGVNVRSVLLAFRHIDPTDGAYSWVGFDNFRRLFNDFGSLPLFRYAFTNSLLLYAFSFAVGISLGLIFSFYIYKKLPAHGIFKVLLFMPSIISPIVMSMVFTQFVERFYPAFVRMLTGTGAAGLLTNPHTTKGTLIFYTLFVSFGTSTLLYVGAMNNISESVTEAAKIEGCGLVREFFSITLPLIYPTVVVFVTTGLAGLFTNQMNLFSFYGSAAEHRYYTMGYYLFINAQNLQNEYNYPYLAALGLFITVIIAPVTLLAHKLMSRFDPTER